jgi:hypothetical protein
LLAAPPDALDLAAGDRPGKPFRFVAAQGPRPVRARADNPRARHQAAQIVRNRLDFR